MAFLYVLVFLIVINVKSQQYSYPNFKQLGIKLPIKLQQHISAVYSNKLFIFGGRNGTVFDNALSTKFWMLDLSQINLVLNETSKNDINTAQLNTQIQWVELNVIAPSYGPSQNGFIRCQHQCSVVIGPYLYIISPYGKTDIASGVIYRLDLSQIPPVYASNLEFASNTPITLKEPCITSSNDNQLIYMVGGNKQGSVNANNEFWKYNISTQTWTQLTSMSINRQSSSCGVSYDNNEIYAFGGRDVTSATSGSNTIIYYTVSTETWTNSLITYPELVWDLQCVNNLYDQTIICSGGLQQISHNKVIIYRSTEKKIVDTVYLKTKTNSYGLAIYEFVNDGIDQASILFITGGVDGGTGITVYDTIQYMVIYNIPTPSPTPSPTLNPTYSPSNAPSIPPTMNPSIVPTQPPSMTPSFAPTLTETTVIETRQGTAPEKQTEIMYGTDPNNSTQTHTLIAMIFISTIAMYISVSHIICSFFML